MNIKNLSELIKQAAKVSFSKSCEKHGKKNVIGFSILSHDTADSCGPVAATRAGLDNFEYGTKNDFMFSPVEWDEFDDGPAFDKVNEEIGKLYDAGDYETDPDWHNKFREFIFEANVRGLELLIQEEFFGSDEQRNDIFIVFCLSDSETFKTHEPSWVKRLNTSLVSERYYKWWDEQNNA
ncbi:MAG: DUF4303 domain-containing protein [Desulfobacterales bacterium]